MSIWQSQRDGEPMDWEKVRIKERERSQQLSPMKNKLSKDVPLDHLSQGLMLVLGFTLVSLPLRWVDRAEGLSLIDQPLQPCWIVNGARLNSLHTENPIFWDDGILEPEGFHYSSPQPVRQPRWQLNHLPQGSFVISNCESVCSSFLQLAPLTIHLIEERGWDVC